ncbi:hypothetical protein FOVSG1_002024 [Fusarium oxysporum f. sp. vasinfectum]
MDLGGHVVAIGPDILHIKTGDRVIGRMNPLNSAGSLSEYVVAAYDDIAVLPETVPLDQAGVAATAALTAYQSIVPFVKKADKVFINGGSSGTVTAALCGKGKVFTLAVDNVGNSPANLFPSAKNFLLSEGKFKFVGGAFSFAVVKNILPSILLPSLLDGSNHKFEVFATKNSHEDMAQISTWMGGGKLKTVIDSTFAFEDVLKANQKLKQGSTRGKILVRVREGKRVIETLRDELN